LNSIVFIGLKLLKERKRQALVSVMGVAIGVAAYIAMSSIMNGFQKYFIKQAVDVNAHITLKVEESDEPDRILKEAYGNDIIADVVGSKPKELKDKITEYKQIIKRYENDPRIVGIAPHLTGQVILTYGTKEKSATMLGIEPAPERSASVVDEYLEYGDLDKLMSDRNSIVMGKILARDLGIRERGKKVTLVSPSGGIYTLKVIDFFNSGITSIDQSRVYINLRTLQAILDKPNQVNELIIRVKDVNEADVIADQMTADTGYYAESWQEAFGNFLQIFKMQHWMTYMIIFAILIVSAFGIFNIMMMTVLEKKKDIAIMKAIGYEDSEITKIFVSQGLLVGVVGAVAGSIIGFGLQEWLESLDFRLEGMIRSSGFILDRDPYYFLYGALFAITFSFLASFYPSWRAARLFPVDIFRSGG